VEFLPEPGLRQDGWQEESEIIYDDNNRVRVENNIREAARDEKLLEYEDENPGLITYSDNDEPEDGQYQHIAELDGQPHQDATPQLGEDMLKLGQVFRLHQAGAIAVVSACDNLAMFVFALPEHLDLVTTGALEKLPRGSKAFAFVSTVLLTRTGDSLGERKLALICHHCMSTHAASDFLLDRAWTNQIAQLPPQSLQEITEMQCEHTELLQLWKTKNEILSLIGGENDDVKVIMCACPSSFFFRIIIFRMLM
jgi:hypothetical protein